MKRIHLKKKKFHKNSNRIIIILMMIIIGVIIMLNNVNKKIGPILFETAQIEIKNLSTIIINKAVTKAMEKNIDMEDLFSTTIDKDGRIQAIDFNPTTVNKTLNLVTTIIQQNIILLEEGKIDNITSLGIEIDSYKIKKLRKGIITEIPMGVISKNIVLSNIGPKIPIRLHYLGNISGNIKTQITPYGINNALVEVIAKIKMDVKIILPFISKTTKLEYNIPLIMKLIQGTVPNYYGGGLLKDSTLYLLP